MGNDSSIRSLGVLDIGSNSVRLVAYDMQANPPKRFFNEKVTCSLGRDLDKTGELSDKGKRRTKKALKGFLTLAEVMKLDVIHAIATAAMRDAKDGEKFAKKLEDKFGITVNIISGQEEAEFSAYGVLSAFPDANGIVADLGGGSLELSTLADGKADSGCSLSIGVLRLHAMRGRERETVENAVSSVKNFYKGQKTLYCVGGSWRAMALVHEIRKQNPIIDSHGYTVDAAEMKEFCEYIYAKEPKKLIKKYNVEKKRSTLIPYAALVLSSLIDALEPEQIVFSNAGLRDGFIYKMMSED